MDSLILVDLQNDFMPAGSLPVPQGLLAVEAANQAQKYFSSIIATKDWHPVDHQAFASQHAQKKPGDMIKLCDVDQYLWPDHCVQNTHGAQLVASLHQEKIDFVVTKGENRDVDSYSAFFDNAHHRETPLHGYLQNRGTKNLFILGVATEYCVKFTALDAQTLGYNTTVIIDGCQGLSQNAADIESTAQELRNAGVHITTMAKLGATASDQMKPWPHHD
jgi:nicotinamidase/pyrazinamidase